MFDKPSTDSSDATIGDPMTAPVEYGGDSACWPTRACSACGCLPDDEGAGRCPACGSPGRFE
jgi:hypothetical protein